MTLDQIICFLEVAKCLNFTKASHNMHITQQGLSHSILSLEKELEIQLFNRTTRNTELTQEGLLLYEKWNEIPYIVKSAINQARLLKEQLNNKIRIGIVELHGVIDYIEKLMEQLSDSFTEIEFDYEFCTEKNGEKLLADNHVDLLITLSFTLENLKEDYNYHMFKETPLYFIISRKHKLAEKNHLSSEDIINETFLIYQKNYSSDAVEQTLRSYYGKSINPKKIINYSNINSLELALIAGKGIYLGFSEIFRNVDNKLVRIPIPQCSERNSVFLIAAWKVSNGDKLKNIIKLLKHQ